MVVFGIIGLGATSLALLACWGVTDCKLFCARQENCRLKSRARRIENDLSFYRKQAQRLARVNGEVNDAKEQVDAEKDYILEVLQGLIDGEKFFVEDDIE